MWLGTRAPGAQASGLQRRRSSVRSVERLRCMLHEGCEQAREAIAQAHEQAAGVGLGLGDAAGAGAIRFETLGQSAGSSTMLLP